MKASLGENVKISLPKAYQTSKPKKNLVIKGVPTEVSEQGFKEFLDLNKINYAKAERLISKKDGRVLEILNWKSRTTPSRGFNCRKPNLSSNKCHL